MSSLLALFRTSRCAFKITARNCHSARHLTCIPILAYNVQHWSARWVESSNALTARLQHSSHFFTSAPSPSAVTTSGNAVSNTTKLPPLSGPAVTQWLFLSASLVFGIIVVGGITRLTESGLSIVEWRPVTGVLPPLSQQEWEEEFDKYKTSPEFKTTNKNMTLAEFKQIFFWEYMHRLLGRVIGIAFVGPLAYFALRKRRLTPGSLPFLGSLALLIGGQGVLGWYMVKSGLRDEILINREVPRVSQYRLAAHLSMALLLYVGMLAAAFRTRTDTSWATQGTWNRLTGVDPWKQVLQNPAVRRFRGAALALSCLVFLTAFSGAFVAGLDAGLIYNEFPTMGGGIIPPLGELMSPFYAQARDHSELFWRNIFENPTTVQFDHRVLGVTTYTATTALFLSSLHPTLKRSLPGVTRHLAAVAFGMVNIQVLLGISTLLFFVPVTVAAAHQAGSVVLLTNMVALLASLRKPGRVAQLWHKMKAGNHKARAATT